MRLATRRTFAALLDPFGVAVAEYERERAGVRILSPIVEPGANPTAAAAAERLVTLLQARGVGASPVTIALSGFGAVSHTMMIPAAPPEILAAVVAREVERIFGIVDPVVRFSVAQPRERRSRRRTEEERSLPLRLVVCGAPRALVDAVTGPFEASGLRVETLTTFASALSRLLGSLEPAGAAAIVATAFGRPFTAFTVDGDLALQLEPPHAPPDVLAALPLLATEQVERGLLFVRQQFRGTAPTRLIVSGSADECEALREMSGGTVSGLRVAAHPADPPEAAILVGAALEAERRDALSFVARPERLAARLRTAIGVSTLSLLAPFAAALLLIVTSLVLAAAVEGAQHEQATLRQHIEERAATLGALRAVALRRARVDGERTILAQARAEHRALASLLARIAFAAPPAVQIDSLTVRVGPEGAAGVVAAHAISVSGAGAIAAIETLDAGIRDLAPGTTATIGDLWWGPAAGATDSTRTAVEAEVEFTVPPATRPTVPGGGVPAVPAVRLPR